MFLALFAVLATNTVAQAQVKSEISGAVTDSSGAAIPGATVTVTGGTLTKTATTDEKGEYKISELPPGTYQVSVTLQGFQEYKTENLVVTAGQPVRMDAAMVPASVASTVDVTSSTIGQVETDTAQLSGTLSSKELTTYQLNGRNFTQLIALAPGVTNRTGQDEALVGVKGSVNYSVNGGRTEYNSFDVDGGDIINPSLNKSSSTLIVYPSVDSIGEMQVLTSNYGAMYGRSASGTILVTTKSGGNDFHGDAYFFLRNNHFNARNFFDETAHAPLYQKYNPGGTIGGPLYIPGVYNTKKDKTFFFFSMEYRHDKEPQPFNQAVPSAAERFCVTAWCMNPPSGITGPFADFTDVCPAAGPDPSNPNTPGLIETFSRTAGQKNYFPDCPGNSAGAGLYTTFPGNVLSYGQTSTHPAYNTATNPVSYALVQQGLIPMPNSTTGCNSSVHSCYDAAISPLTTFREELFRIDHILSPTQKIYFRYIHDAYNTGTATPLWAFVQNSFPTVQNDLTGPGLSLAAHLTSTIGTRFVNDVAMAYVTDHISLQATNGPGLVSVNRPGTASDSPGCITPCTIGSIFGPYNIPGFNFGQKSPGIILDGTEAAYGSHGFAVDTGFTPWSHSNPTYSPRDDATFVLGKHTLQFGVLFILAQRNEINPPVGSNIGDVQGLATFANISSENTTGNSWADFVAGYPRTFEQTSAQFKYHQSYKIAEPYLQDNWKVTPRLTLNLGLRVSLFGLYSEKNHYSYDWLPSEYSPSLANEVQVVNGTFYGTGNLVYKGTTTPVPLNPLNLDPHLTNGLVRCGESATKSGIGVPASCMFGHVFNPAPRIGFAWDPFGDGKTSIRAGYGIFFEHGTGNEANTGSLEGSAGPYQEGGVLDMTEYAPGTWANIGANGAAYPLNVTQLPTRVQWPYMQQWSFSIQRQLPFDSLATIAYVGSKGTHLTAETQANQIIPLQQSLNPFAPGQPLTLADCQSFVSFPDQHYVINNQTITPSSPVFSNLQAACVGQLPGVNFDPLALLTRSNSLAPTIGQIFSLQNVANSDYNALQFTLRRAKGPVTLGVSYTYSHSLDNSSDRTSVSFVNAYDLNQSRANSDFDTRHNLTISYIYQLPLRAAFHHLTQWGDTDSSNVVKSTGDESNVSKHLWEGWELSGITVYQSGVPFSVLNNGSPDGISTPDNAGVAAVNGDGSYPDVVKNPAPLPARAGDSLSTFGPLLGNPNEFVAPTGLTYGNAGRNFFNNPSRLNFDMAILKNTPLSEGKSLQFRVEAFNVFNHTQFRITDPSNPGDTGNNVISCYGGPTNSAGDPACVATSSFLHPVDAHRPRTIQLGFKFIF